MPHPDHAELMMKELEKETSQPPTTPATCQERVLEIARDAVSTAKCLAITHCHNATLAAMEAHEKSLANIEQSDRCKIEEQRWEIERLKAELKMWKPMTPEEAEKALDEAVPIPISDEEIDRIVSKVTDPTYHPSEPEHVLMAAKIRQLRDARIKLAIDVLGLFTEYRDKHGMPEEIAKAKAICEVIDGESL